jgi:hypothetical protein
VSSSAYVFETARCLFQAYYVINVSSKLQQQIKSFGCLLPAGQMVFVEASSDVNEIYKSRYKYNKRGRLFAFDDGGHAQK